MSNIRNFFLDIEQEYPGKNWGKKLLGFFVNPSIRACFLIRLSQYKNPMTYWIARNALIAMHSIDVGRGAKIGAPIILPHPINIVIGKGAVLGQFVTVYQGVTIGSKGSKYPRIDSNVVIYPNAVIAGDSHIGDGATIGACTFVDCDVGPGVVFYRKR